MIHRFFRKTSTHMTSTSSNKIHALEKSGGGGALTSGSPMVVGPCDGCIEDLRFGIRIGGYLCTGLATSLSRGKKTGEGKKRERLLILGMLINIHELSSLASIFKMTRLLPTVSSKLESTIVKEHRRALLCCIIFLSKHMIGYWFFVKGCLLDRVLSSQRPRLPSITSLSRFRIFSRFCREREL